MNTPSSLQLLQQADAPPGSDGFKLTGRAREGVGLCRVWLRRSSPWDRYLDPRLERGAWDVRFYVKLDSAYSLDTEFTVRELDGLLDTWAFDDVSAALGALSPNGDPVHDTTLAWALRATGGGTPAAEPAAEPAAAEPVAAEPAAAEPAAEPAAAAPSAEAPKAPKLAGLADGWGEAEEAADRVSGSFTAVPEDSDAS